MNITKSVILASTSKYREALLARLGIPYETWAPDFSERTLDHLFQESNAEHCATQIALGKARSVQTQVGPWMIPPIEKWILAADQIVWVSLSAVERKQLHKPETIEAAVEQLMMLCGRVFYSTTGVVLMSAHEPATFGWRASTEKITMRNYSEVEARAYVQRFKPLDCVGSYRMEDAGPLLFQKAPEGDWTGCQGFPIFCIAEMLRAAGVLPP